MKTSLIISTYNWPEALNLCLKSLLIQTQFPDEVIIADDGSTIETTNLIKSFSAEASFPVIHVWHEDTGFKKTIILNKAIAKSNFEYIIQIDGDIILHPKFIVDHIKAARKGFFIRGTRVLLTKTLSKKVLSSSQIRFSFLGRGIKKRFNGIHIPLLRWFNYSLFSSKSYKHIKGCNMAFWREDLIRVNGYNESIYEWGREDNEIAARLINNGVYKRSIIWAMIAYHIEHRKQSKARLSLNTTILDKTVSSRSVWCKNGLDKYLGVRQILI